jgi:hypothetical protein
MTSHRKRPPDPSQLKNLIDLPAARNCEFKAEQCEYLAKKARLPEHMAILEYLADRWRIASSLLRRPQ